MSTANKTEAPEPGGGPVSTRMAMIAKNNETGDHAVFGPVYTESGLNLMREVIEKRGGWTVVLTCPLISKAELTEVQMPRASRRLRPEETGGSSD